VPNEQAKMIEGELLARDLRFAFVAARFNDFVVEPLIRGALDALKRHGASEKQIEIVRVPGAFDMPIVARKLALSRRYDALIALGAVVRGQTPHFDYVAGECASGLARIALESGVPIAFGVLTTDTMEQAVDRAGGKAGNKGADAAMTAIEMANLLRRLEP
jgi:6,7-dimethyl-8-ribityllumazine synthase